MLFRLSSMHVGSKFLPFCPDSLIASDQLPDEVSRAPPTEETEPAVEGRRVWNRPLEFGLWDDSYRGKGYSLFEDGDAGERIGDG
jgi:hypothetical protein